MLTMTHNRRATAKTPSLAADLRQIVCYGLLDFDDEFGITHVGIFTARYGYLAAWEHRPLLAELGAVASLAHLREEFRQMLRANRPPVVSPRR